MLPIVRLFFLALFFCGGSHADSGIDAAGQRIRIAIKSEPPTLNSLQASDNISGFILNHVMEGLLRYDGRNELAPGVAERWELRPDGATFWLRRDARWSDGRAVTAQDFVFAWRRVVEPKTASRYAFILFPVKNAEKIARGELPADRLGVTAVGDDRLDVQFERPCPYFLGLTAFATYFPLREDFVRARGERYAADAGDLLFNGAFVLTRWQHGARLTLEKNSQYWNAAAIRLREIDIPYITGDTTARFNLFQEGSIAMAQLDATTLEEAVARGAAMQLFDAGGVFFLEFNLAAGRPTANIHLRRAIQAIFSAAQLTGKIIGLPGNRATVSLFPHSVKGIEKPFREEFPAPLPPRGLALARRELALAQRELGIDRSPTKQSSTKQSSTNQWPPLVILARSSPTEKKIAEYFQQLLQQGLGIPVRIDIQIFKQSIDKMNRGDFDVAVAGWLPDFDDAITFGDLMASWNENNRGRYDSPQYDALVRAANATADPAQRMPLFAQMQKMLIDDVPILPMFESTEVYAVDPRLRGVTRALFGGDLDFRAAYVDAAPGAAR